jgi:putative endopeptidase
MNQFTMELDAELLPLLFPDFPEEQFRQMVEKIRTSLIAGLEANTWLSPEGKAAAIKKMQVARLMVVKPRNVDEWNFNPEADYDATKPLANSQLLRKKTIEKELSELKDARKRNRWLMGPLTVNAYYVPMDNTFVLPIGILQYPLYDPSLPETVNLAAIGTIIGHELGHGIDDKGAKYDEEGRFKNWMSEKDLSEFKKRGESFVARFDKIGHNGKLTLGENIGDHVGLTAAYRAAFSAGKGSVQAKKDFFIQYGRAWCQVIRPKFKDMLLKTDPHALGHARVNEQVKNLPGFQEAFACTTKDKLYLSPKDQIHVW